ncbi:lactococcin 972 family bacteriocin [Brachybacterium muris]|uniref:lactococcin 972 family bacteriocin n=3 Tax=Brachybacterium muris TaxID=219301 RepID=UPI0021A367D6|nr:lactococcin 972 family bacteriocin [Brachybacterium muris]MCT1431395.1 lactococcin 972 family bacteriocin [Brachybacterium muris]
MSVPKISMIRRAVASLFATSLIACGAVTAAEAVVVTKYPCGGTWRYESSVPRDILVFSSYFNSRTVHRASVINGNGVYKESGWKNSGVNADASVMGTDKVDEAYYANKNPERYCK